MKTSDLRHDCWVQRDRPAQWWVQNHHAIPGPNGLLRHRIGEHCIGHGDGTWDLIRGEFS